MYCKFSPTSNLKTACKVLLGIGFFITLSHSEQARSYSPADSLRWFLHGAYEGQDGNGNKIGAEVAIELDTFQINLLPGGLPPFGNPTDSIKGVQKDSLVEFKTTGFDIIVDGKTVKARTQKFGDFEIGKINRISPSQGAQVPEGGILLFDGSNIDEWISDHKEGEETVSDYGDGIPIGETWLRSGASTVRKFQDATYHVEFQLPFNPGGGRKRSNSGVYIQGRYELQTVDSFGRTRTGTADCGYNGEICGKILPDFFMTFPPLTWQTFDVQFKAPKYEGNDVIDSARMTVYHNGVLIHDNVGIVDNTSMSPLRDGPEAGPLNFQKKKGDVYFRNLWVKEGIADLPVGIRHGDKRGRITQIKKAGSSHLSITPVDILGRQFRSQAQPSKVLKVHVTPQPNQPQSDQ